MKMRCIAKTETAGKLLDEKATWWNLEFTGIQGFEVSLVMTGMAVIRAQHYVVGQIYEVEIHRYDG